MLILLDIDRTLVHAVERRLVLPEWLDHYKYFFWAEYVVFVRPHLTTFLEFLYSQPAWKIGLFTGGSKEYCEKVAEELFSSYSLYCKFSWNEYDESFDFDGKRKSTAYIAYKLKIPEDEILLLDDSVSLCKQLGDRAFLVEKFIVCFDFTNTFVPEMIQNEGLLKCITELKDKYLD